VGYAKVSKAIGKGAETMEYLEKRINELIKPILLGITGLGLICMGELLVIMWLVSPK
jgi:hypothetical protein